MMEAIDVPLGLKTEKIKTKFIDSSILWTCEKMSRFSNTVDTLCYRY